MKKVNGVHAPMLLVTDDVSRRVHIIYFYFESYTETTGYIDESC